MSKLTEKDLKVLKAYAFDSKNRELYWNYLAQLPGNDGYGLLALGVVRNDNMPGAVANSYAREHAQQHDGRVLSEREWEAFGIDLIQRDYALRKQQFDKQRNPQAALNLPVWEVQQAHDGSFRNADIDPNAWTPRLLLEAARKQDGEPAAERIWAQMLDNERLGLDRAFHTSRAIGRYLPPDQAASYLAKLTLASALAAESHDHVNPNQIGGQHFYYQYDGRRQQWQAVQAGGGSVPTGPRLRTVTDPDVVAELDDIRRLRLERQQKAMQFQAEDPYRTLARSPKTLAGHDAVPTPGLPLPASLKHPDHPGHADFRHALAAVQRMEQQAGVPGGPHSEQVAAALATRAVQERFDLREVQLTLGGQGQLQIRERSLPTPRPALDTGVALQQSLEQHSAAWAQAASPHYAAPTAERTALQQQALQRLTPNDRALFERIRQQVPPGVDDDRVAAAMLAARAGGIQRADQVEHVALRGDLLFVLGTTPGFRAALDLAQPAPPLQVSAEQAHAMTQQQAIDARQHEVLEPQDRAMRMA